MARRMRPGASGATTTVHKIAQPRALICHLCGRQYGSASLSIHLKTCEQRYEQEHGKRAPRPPDVPLSAGADAQNEAAFATFQNEALVPCEHCGRTFLPDRLQVHLRSCRPKGSPYGPPPRQPSSQLRSTMPASATPSPSGRASSPGPGSRAPRMLICHLCGRQYGSSSLSIHLKTCEQRYEQEHGKRAPPPPDVPLSAGADAQNEAAFATFQNEALVPCEHCGRTFLPDRLRVHLRSCRGDSSSRRPSTARSRLPSMDDGGGAEGRRSAPPASRRMSSPGPGSRAPRMLICHLCGRQYGSSSLSIHLKTCEQRYEQEHGKRAPPPPDVPLSAGADAQNEAAFATFQNEALVPCEHCGRTFLPDRLRVHLRSCRGDSSSRRPSTARSRLPSMDDGGGAEGRRSAPPASRRMSSPGPGSRAPRMLICHLCGRQYGSSSLSIHLKTCEQRYEQEHGKRAPPPPDVPLSAGADAQNEAAFATFQNEALVPCEHCGRTFLPDRLQVHLRSCRPKGSPYGPPPRQPSSQLRSTMPASATPSPSSRRMSSPGPGSRAPRMLICHLCGRQYGSSSLSIHLKTCEQRYEQEHGKRAPRPPDVPLSAGADAQNEAAFATFQNEALVPCEHCGRTFLPDRLQVHLRSCRGDSSSRRPSTARSRLPSMDDGGGAEGRRSAPPASRRMSSPGPGSRAPRMLICHLCGRQYGSSSLSIHLKTCEQRYEQEHGKRAPPPPDVPLSAGADAQNEAAFATFQNEALVPCEHCGRTFLPDRLQVHLRSCRPKGSPYGPPPRQPSSQLRSTMPASATPSPSGRASSPGPGSRAPRMLICHLCGRQYGSSSLSIHLKTCEQRYEQEHGKRAPPPPDVPLSAGADAQNEAAFATFQNEALVPCEHCGRTFLPDRLQVHLRSCRPR